MLREFNFIEDFTNALYYNGNEQVGLYERMDEEIYDALIKMKQIRDNYKNAFSNGEYEMKRFGIWVYPILKERFDHILESDPSGFLMECVELLDPRTAGIKLTVPWEKPEL